jgi:hypothetical protein
MTDKPGPVPVTFIDNPQAPEVYVDDVSGVALVWERRQIG